MAGRLLRGSVLALAAAASVISALAFYEMYWRWRGCFNEEGRCFDPVEGVVYHAQSGEVWGILLAASALVLLEGIGWWLR